jgi:hypothetical protein
MYKNGIGVDEKERRRLSRTLRAEHIARRKELLELVGIRGFRCTPNDIRSLIYKRHATAAISRYNLRDPYDPKMWTKSGKAVKVTEDALRQVLIHPDTPPELVHIIEVYWSAQQPRKARATFVKSDDILHAIGRDGRLRPGWNSCGTDTGRFSCSSPNVMTLPQELRSMYAAPRGRLLVHGDWSQLELRVMAAVSGDRALAEALQTGDVYSYGARKLFGIPEGEPVKREARQAMKVTHLACLPSGTRVALLNGGKAIEDVQPGEWAYSWADGQYTLTKVKAVHFSGVQRCLRVTVRDGARKLKELLITNNHRMLMRDGSYKRVDELIEGDRLMPFRRNTIKAGYQQIDPFNNGSRFYEHRWVCPGHEVVHHKNHIKYDNRPENLEGQTDYDHRHHHGTIRGRVRVQRAKLHSPEWQVKIKAANVLAVAAKKAHAKTKAACPCGQPGYAKGLCRPCYMRGYHGRKLPNHDVVSVEDSGLDLPTWDLEVENEAHNFALEKMVFVHNSQYAAGTAQVYSQYLAQDRTGKYARVKMFHEGWKKTYAGTVKYWEDEMTRVSLCGYSASCIMDRRRVYPAPPTINECANYPVQSTAADVANLTIIELEKRLAVEFPTALLIMQLHDALDVECDEDDVFGVCALMDEVMETPRKINGVSYVFPTEVKVGVRWSEV